MTKDNEEFDINSLTRDQIRSLSNAQLDELSDDQFSYISFKSATRKSEALASKIAKAMEGQTPAIIEAMISEPFLYVGPEIEIIPGLKVVFQTMYDVQTSDIWEQSAIFEETSRSNFNTQANIVKLFLAHAVRTINGKPLGDVVIGKDFFLSMKAAPAEAKKAMVVGRDRRMEDLGRRPQSLLQMIHQAHTIFGAHIDAAVHFSPSGDKDVDTKRIAEIADAVGKSTGPERAGQKQT